MQASKFTVKPLSKAPAKVNLDNSTPVGEKQSRLRALTTELRALEENLRLGGGPDKIDRQHSQGKLTARERIDLLLDKDSASQEIGLLVAYDQYKAGVRSQESGVREKQNQSQASSLKSQPDKSHRIEVGSAPTAGVVTTIGQVAGREVVVVANDATVKAGSWWPETIKKILRAQEAALR